MKNVYKLKSLAFSLMELLVVISIIAIVAAIAIPNYKDYKAKAQVVKGITVLNQLTNEIILNLIRRGGIPTTDTEVKFRGNTIRENRNVEVSNIPPFKVLFWDIRNAAGDILVSGYFSDLAISGFTPATSIGSLGAKSRVGVLAKSINGEYKIYCGTVWNTATDVDLRFLPAHCQCGALASDIGIIGVTEFCGS